MSLMKLKEKQRPGSTGFVSGRVSCKLGVSYFYSSVVQLAVLCSEIRPSQTLGVACNVN